MPKIMDLVAVVYIHGPLCYSVQYLILKAHLNFGPKWRDPLFSFSDLQFNVNHSSYFSSIAVILMFCGF
jgi:hypothetical protein